MNQTVIIILAAGSSSRLGQPKQLLPFRNKLLIQCIADAAIKAKPGLVVVVTGANTEEVSAALADKDITLVYNQNWREGMASGIVAGVLKVMDLRNGVANIILSVCDQPFVNEGLFNELIEKKKETGKGVIACSYAGTMGTPALFDRKYFNELQNLKGTEGAKVLLKKLKHDLASVSFPEGNIDIDTEEGIPI